MRRDFRLLTTMATMLMVRCTDPFPPLPEKLSIGDIVTVGSRNVLGCVSAHTWTRLRLRNGDAFVQKLHEYIKASECTLDDRGPARITDQDTHRRLLRKRLMDRTAEMWVMTASIER